VAKEENTRRKFLVNAAKTTVAVTAGSGALLSNASANDTKAELSASVIKGTSKKEEILYQKTAHWDNYYSRAF
jgi:ribosomal protein L28